MREIESRRQAFFFFLFHLINSSAAQKAGPACAACALFLSPRTRYIYREVPLFPAAWSYSKSLVRAVSIASSLMRFISRFFFRSRTDRLSDAHGVSQPSFGCTYRPQRESGESPPRRSYRRSARPRSCRRLSLALRGPGPGFGYVS